MHCSYSFGNNPDDYRPAHRLQWLRKIVGDPAELEVPGQLALWAAIISIVAKEAMFWYTRNAAQKSIPAH